jgi:hypothetical protein
MENGGRGNDDEVNDLASISFGSGTEYLAEAYVLIDFRDTVSGTEKDGMALIKLHMTMCIKHYHALVLQLHPSGDCGGHPPTDPLAIE